MTIVDRLLLDTTVLIALSKDQRNVAETLSAFVTMGSIPGVCAVSVAEFLVGVPVEHRRRLEGWVATFEYWDISREAAALAGILRHDLARQGRAIHIADALMAATALVTDATLLTNNVRDFQVPRLKVMRLGS